MLKSCYQFFLLFVFSSTLEARSRAALLDAAAATAAIAVVRRGEQNSSVVE